MASRPELRGGQHFYGNEVDHIGGQGTDSPLMASLGHPVVIGGQKGYAFNFKKRWDMKGLKNLKRDIDDYLKVRPTSPIQVTKDMYDELQTTAKGQLTRFGFKNESGQIFFRNGPREVLITLLGSK
jgi:hypothetical protein